MSAKSNCLAFGKTCSICKRKNQAPKVCRYKKKNVQELKDTQVNRGGAEFFTLNTSTKTRDKVKINGKFFHMQVDTGSDITLIPVNFWLDLGKPRLKKSALQLKQFDGTIIKTLGTFEVTFETKNRFEICTYYSRGMYLRLWTPRHRCIKSWHIKIS